MLTSRCQCAAYIYDFISIPGCLLQELYVVAFRCQMALDMKYGRQMPQFKIV